MDLAAESTRLRLDELAVRLCRTLESASVPHALLKGPSTSTWLYQPPRSYSDVDLLVPVSQLDRAAAALTASGQAEARSGRPGEEASHSLLMHSSEGFEVDLHLSLPATQAASDDRLWNALSPHLTPLAMDVGTVTALDVVGRCLVLALHAVNDHSGGPTEDLRRARAVTGAATWREVYDLAARLDMADLVDAGLLVVEGGDLEALSARARLHVTRAPSAALGLQRLVDTPRRELPVAVWHELVPSRGFMAQAEGRPELAGAGLAAAHLRRWRRLARELPTALRAWRSARRTLHSLHHPPRGEYQREN